jgi:hypothetical protein
MVFTMVFTATATGMTVTVAAGPRAPHQRRGDDIATQTTSLATAQTGAATTGAASDKGRTLQRLWRAGDAGWRR